MWHLCLSPGSDRIPVHLPVSGNEPCGHFYLQGTRERVWLWPQKENTSILKHSVILCDVSDLPRVNDSQSECSQSCAVEDGHTKRHASRWSRHGIWLLCHCKACPPLPLLPPLSWSHFPQYFIFQICLRHACFTFCVCVFCLHTCRCTSGAGE